MKATVIPVVVVALGAVSNGLEKSLEGLEIRGKNRDHRDCSIAEIDQNTMKSPGDMRILVVFQWKSTSKGWCEKLARSKIIIIIIIISDFDIHTDHLISARRPDFIIIKKKKKRFCKIVDFDVPADHRKKNLKECEKKYKYLDLARELKKLWNMKVTIVPIVSGAFGTMTKGLLKGLEDLEVGGRVETTQTTALLKTARILRRVLETWGDLLSLKLQWKTISWRWCEGL